MEKTITVQVKDVYGRQTIYPVCDSAKLFARLIGQKTFSVEKHLKIIQQLGYEVKFKTTTLEG